MRTTNWFAVVGLLSFVQHEHLHSQDIQGMSFHFVPISSFESTGQIDLYVAEQAQVDRPYVIIDYGPTTDTLHYVESFSLTSGVRKIYRGQLTYFGFGYYEIQINVGLRVSDISNIANSGTSIISLGGVQTISPTSGQNAHSHLGNTGLEYDSQGGVVVFDPSVFNDDDDSLHFALIDCSGGGYSPVSNLSIDPVSGIISFDQSIPGRYNVCFMISEWKRNGNNPVLKGTASTEISFLVPDDVGLTQIGNPGITLYYDVEQSILRWKGNTTDQYHIDISDAMGRTISTHTVPKHQHYVDLSHLQVGTYFVHGKDGKGASSTELAIVKPK